MPQLGEVRKNEKYQKFIWSACERCGSERWELIVRGKPISKCCRSCHAKEVQPSIWAGYKKRPIKIGLRAMRTIEKLVNQNIIKRLPCALCGNEKSLGHHPDYSKPLEIVWLCQKHHTIIHRSTFKN